MLGGADKSLSEESYKELKEYRKRVWEKIEWLFNGHRIKETLTPEELDYNCGN